MLRRGLLGFVFTVLGVYTSSLFAQHERDTDLNVHGDDMVHAYLERDANRIHGTFLNGVETKADWEKSRPAYKEEFLYMLGLSPMPEKTPLRTVVTGTLKGEGYEVDKLHFQSSPGLYVTGNLYRPASANPGERFPTILYVCGHADRGRNGNKAAYQSNGIWFARHGYVCLMIDTLQRGEVAGIHHGTYRENRWWWHSRGYTSAGVECWNGIRAIDYLVSRPDVDANRIGVTGISGGGAVTFWIAGADERVKVAIPISGMADLPSYLSDRVINGHCDCMFLHNTYEWPWTRIAAMIAPRPLLFVNSDQDPIFPMNANERVSNRLETVYSLFGAGDKVDTVVSIGGHAYREDIRKASYRFMNTYFKNDPSEVLDSEVDLVSGRRGEETHPIPPESLRVFPEDSDLPKDELNSTIDQHFVPMAEVDVPAQSGFESWKTELVEKLREVTFRNFPKQIPAARVKEEDASGKLILETEPGIEVAIKAPSRGSISSDPNRIALVVNTSGADSLDWGEWVEDTDLVFVLEPRGVGRTRWTVRNPPNYVARSHALLGRTVDSLRVWDIVATARYLKQKYGDRLPVCVLGKGGDAALSAYAMLLEPEIDGGVFHYPVLSHMDEKAPALLNVLRVCDVPDVIGALAPRPIVISGIGSDELDKVARIYGAANARDQIEWK